MGKECTWLGVLVILVGWQSHVSIGELFFSRSHEGWLVDDTAKTFIEISKALLAFPGISMVHWKLLEKEFPFWKSLFSDFKSFYEVLFGD